MRGRAGYAFDRILIYGTGGAAFGNVQASCAALPFSSSTQTGWTAGAGVEFAFTPNLTGKSNTSTSIWATSPVPLGIAAFPAAHLAHFRLAHREHRPRRHQLQILVTGLGSKPRIRQSDTRVIETLVWALTPLLNLRWSILLPWVTIFLMVVLDEGKCVSAYARALGVKDRRGVSRYLRDIGERARNGGPGLGLVTVEQLPTHSRARARVLLTAKGRSVAQAILQQMRRPVDERRPAQCKNCKRCFCPNDLAPRPVHPDVG